MVASRLRTALPALLSLALLGGCTGSDPQAATPSTKTISPTTPSPTPTTRAFAQLEARFHAHLGVYVLDTGTGRTVFYQASTRFAYCSTFKAITAAMLLMRDAPLSRLVTYRASDLVEYSPITSQHVSTGMTLEAVMQAAIEDSDNTAANLLLAQLGGPHQFQQALRGIGDATTTSDRTEPSLNDATPGGTRDTSTAQALGTDLRQFVLGNRLSPSRRRLLTGWLLHNTTGGPYIRAGVPAGWQVGDKTGNGYWGTRNDIAIAWPPPSVQHGAPVVIAVLSSRDSINANSDDALIADATKAALADLAQ
ncbi:MAG TPA: class A beta-lactamase [Streptosporangiaceae bacterium]|jgi:beta-lactamase class A